MKIPKCRYFDGFFEKKLFGQKFSIFTYFLMIFRIFLYFKKNENPENPKKIVIFRKFNQKSSFCVPVGLYHPVSENIGHAGHFGVFTTHTTLFFALFGSIEVALRFVRNGENPGGIFADFGECSKTREENVMG